MRVVFQAHNAPALRMNVRVVNSAEYPEGTLYIIRLTPFQVKRLSAYEQAHGIRILLDDNLMWELDDNNETHVWR